MFLAVFVRPTLIMGPTSVAVKQNKITHFECRFNASVQKHLSIVEWLKDGTNIIASSKYLITIGIEPELLFTELSITNVSRNDEGIYSCKCYYNTTVLDRFHINTSVVVQGLATLELKDQGTYV